MRGEHVFVFCYDISSDSARRRAAGMLERHATRVQDSVFEMRAESRKANALLAELARLRGPDDSIRMYCLTETGRKLSQAEGGAPIPEETEFWLF